ncbi:hypothetical protein Tco_0843023 [Tanacetum coccineum]|uniref:No apical meristem-associated C-terminal domain-containing protein n=1 Tax=Tanacetum coccineum TaxID=301880 RepID=A0ABQ5B1T2_9ASTR
MEGVHKKQRENNPLSIWTRTMMMTCQDEEILPVGIRTKKCCWPRLGSSTRRRQYRKRPTRRRLLNLISRFQLSEIKSSCSSYQKYDDGKNGPGLHAEMQRRLILSDMVNKKFQYVHVWNILKNYPKWNVAEPIDEDNLQKLFGPDPRERPADKQRALKKQKSVDTSSVGGSTGGSTERSQSESISSLVSQDYKRKCDAVERAYEAKREKELAIMKKELAIMQCKELKICSLLDTSSVASVANQNEPSLKRNKLK